MNRAMRCAALWLMVGGSLGLLSVEFSPGAVAQDAVAGSNSTVATVPADVDWPCWRGARRDGHVRFTPPSKWPEQLTKRWSVQVGIGHASPVVQGDRIYQFSREGEEEVVRCLDWSGQPKWRTSYAAPYKMNSAAQGHGKGPKSTPAIGSGRLYTLGISGILSAWSVADGKQVWQHNYTGKFPKTAPLFGAAMSPLVRSNFCFAHVGGHDGGALVALSGKTGQTRWAWTADGPAYTSPIVATLGGVKQLITQSQKHCVALSGSGKELWKIPYETQYVQNVITPVVFGDIVVFSGYQRGTTAYRITRSGDRFRVSEAWNNSKLSMYMSSPIVVGERLFGMAQEGAGRTFCLDVKSGTTIWRGPGREGENGLLLGLGPAIAILTTNGRLRMFDAASDNYHELTRYELAETPTWAHPVILGDRVLIKDENNLTLWTFSAASK